jgi:hypothetical protein
MNKLLCIDVEELKQFKEVERNYWDTVSSPKICAIFLTENLSKQISKYVALIDVNELDEVAVQETSLNWFHSLDKRSYYTIHARMHVGIDFVYFSGAFAPQKIPEFQSKRVPLNNFELNKEVSSKTVNTALLNSPQAIVIISEIERLSEEQSILWERQDSLSDLKASFDELRPASCLVESGENDGFSASLVNEIAALEKTSESLEGLLESKCWYLCKTILGLSINDRVVMISENNVKSCEILLKTVSYSDGELYLNGPKVLQSGAIGKRSEMVMITLVQANEP